MEDFVGSLRGPNEVAEDGVYAEGGIADEDAGGNGDAKEVGDGGAGNVEEGGVGVADEGVRLGFREGLVGTEAGLDGARDGAKRACGGIRDGTVGEGREGGKGSPLLRLR